MSFFLSEFNAASKQKRAYRSDKPASTRVNYVHKTFLHVSLIPFSHPQNKDVCICVCTCTCVCRSVCVYSSMCVCIYVQACVHMCGSMCVYMCMHASMWVCMCVSIYVYVSFISLHQIWKAIILHWDKVYSYHSIRNFSFWLAGSTLFGIIARLLVMVWVHDRTKSCPWCKRKRK